MEEIAQLKYYGNFSLFEISKLTHEERQFFVQWINTTKQKEAKANASPAAEPQPQFGPR